MAVFTAIGAAVFGAGTFLAAATAAGLQIAAGIAVSLISKAMQGEPQSSRFGVQGQVQTGDDTPRSVLLGFNCTAGSKVYQNEWGDGGVMSTRVIALADTPIRELRHVIVDGVACTLLTGEEHPQYGWPVEEYRKKIFLGTIDQDHAWVKFYDGTQTTADSFLVGTVASVERPYTATRVGRGVPYAIVTTRAPERGDGEETPLFQGFPQFKFVTYGMKLYDPSRDTTVGGSGAHRWDDPATWGGDGDFLVPVQIYNMLRGIRFAGQWVYGLQAAKTSRFPVANWIAAIAKARATIAGPDGAEPTYRAGGEIQVGAPLHIALEALITAGNGRIAETGGEYKLYLGADSGPVMSFTDGDILSTEEQTFTPFHSLADTVNGVTATYPNPEVGWAVKKAPTLLRPDLEELDGNRRLLASVALDLVPFKGQVQRIMKWALAESLRARRHTFVLGPEFRVLEPGDVVQWTSARNGYDDKIFRVDGVIYKSNLDVIVDLTEIDPSDYDWDQATDYTPVVDGPLTLVGPRPMPMLGWQVFPATIYDNDGNGRRPAIEVWYASGLPSVQRVRVQVRLAGTTGVVFDGEVPYGEPWKTILQGQFLPNTSYEVRGVFVGLPAATWSAWLAVTTPDIKLGPRDVIYGDLDLDALGQQAQGYFTWMARSIRETIEQAQGLALLAGDQELANAAQFDEMRRSLGTITSDLSATFDETITTAIIPLNGRMTAVADAVTELGAGDGSDVNTVRIRYTAMSGPEGYSRVGIETRYDNGDPDDFRLAGDYWDTPNNPAQPTRRVVIAEQFVIAATPEDVGFNPFIFEDGVAKMTAARIGDLRGGRIRPLADDEMDVNFFEKYISIRLS